MKHSEIPERHQPTRIRRMLDLAELLRYRIRFLSLEWCRFFKALLGHVDPCFIPEATFRTRIEPMPVLKGAPLFGEHTVTTMELVARRERSGWHV